MVIVHVVAPAEFGGLERVVQMLASGLRGLGHEVQDGRRLRFKVSCRDEIESIGEGFHERTIVDHARFMQRLARKNPG